MATAVSPTDPPAAGSGFCSALDTELLLVPVLFFSFIFFIF